MKNINCRLNIIPRPLSIQEAQGSFTINNETTIWISPEISSWLMIPAAEMKVYNKPSKILQKDRCSRVSDLIETWLAPLRQKTGQPLPVDNSEREENIISLLPALAPLDSENSRKENSREEYHFSVNRKQIELSAADAPGLFYALQTLIQSIDEKGEIKSCLIEDSPQFSWRGLHLDSGRFFQPPSEIKLFLDYMALFKMNVFHWHLTEDQGWRLEIKRFPRLTEIGSRREETVWGHVSLGGKEDDGVPHQGYYSHEDVKDIVSYARDRGIMVVPEIDLPGHSRAAIAAYPELGVSCQSMAVFTKWGVCKDIYNPEENTISFLEKVMDEVLELFPSPWIHIGGDEAVKDQWKESDRVKELLKERGLKDYDEMQSWFIKKIVSYLDRKGRKAVGWDEIMEGGAPDGAAIMAWRHEKHGIDAARLGLPVLMCPCQWTYLDYRDTRSSYEPLTISTVNEPLKSIDLKHVYSWNPLPDALSNDEKNLIMGGQGQIWTEYMPGPSMRQYMTWPRASALAEVLWSHPEQRNFEDFSNRLESALRMMDRDGIIYHFQSDLIDGGTLKPTDSKWREQSFNINQKGKARRLQILFRRKGFNNYSQIAEIRLETPDGREYSDSHMGYCGRFNRLNVYTLGDGTDFDLENCRITIRSRACSRIPGKNGKRIRSSRLSWAYRKK